MLFLPELNINITNHVISQIVTNIQAFNLSIFAQLLKKILIKILEVLLDLAGVHRLALRVKSGGDSVVKALVHVREEEGGADAGLRV